MVYFFRNDLRIYVKLYLFFCSGPVSCIAFPSCWDVFSVPSLTKLHLRRSQAQAAVRLLLSHGWQVDPQTAMTSLTSIATHLFAQPFSPANQGTPWPMSHQSCIVSAQLVL